MLAEATANDRASENGAGVSPAPLLMKYFCCPECAGHTPENVVELMRARIQRLEAKVREIDVRTK